MPNQTMLDFFNSCLASVGSFLMQEPYSYFTAIFVGILVIGIVARLLRLGYKSYR